MALTLLAATGCDAPESTRGGTPTAPPVAATPTTHSTESTAADTDYSHLLLAPSDVSDQEDAFALWSTTRNPGGVPGASALLVNDKDTRAIANTVVIYPDAATATSTLRNALPEVGTVVVGGTPRPAPVGTDGTMVVGTSADGKKAATLLLYTHGPALVRLQFESAPGDATTDKFVINVGKMQLIALRTAMGER